MIVFIGSSETAVVSASRVQSTDKKEYEYRGRFLKKKSTHIYLYINKNKIHVWSFFFSFHPLYLPIPRYLSCIHYNACPISRISVSTK